MNTPYYFHVQIPEANASFTWIGGGLRLSKRAGYVWLTKSGGLPVLEVRREHVAPSTREAAARRFAEDRIAAKAPLN